MKRGFMDPGNGGRVDCGNGGVGVGVSNGEKGRTAVTKQQ